VLRYGAVCCSVLQCVAVCCSGTALRCLDLGGLAKILEDALGSWRFVAECCSVLQCVAVWCSVFYVVCCSVLQRVAVCCSVLSYWGAHECLTR